MRTDTGRISPDIRRISIPEFRTIASARALPPTKMPYRQFQASDELSKCAVPSPSEADLLSPPGARLRASGDFFCGTIPWGAATLLCFRSLGADEEIVKFYLRG